MPKLKYFGPALATLVVVFVMLFQAWQLRSSLDEREWEHSNSLLVNVASEAQGALAMQFGHEGAPHVRQVVAGISVFGRRTQTFLLDPALDVYYADQLGYDGMKPEQLPIALDRQTLQDLQRSLQGRLIEDRAAGTVTALYPVSMTDEHEPPYSRVGVLVIQLDVAQGLAEVRREILDTLAGSAYVVLALVLVLAVGIHFALTRRVNRLLDATGSYVAGDYERRIPVHGADEIAAIARAFNNVADAVAEKQTDLLASREEVRQLNHSLEARVELRTAELQTILDLAPDGIIVITPSGAVERFNRAAEALFGWSEAEIVGQNISLLMPMAERASHDQHLARFQATGKSRVLGIDREVIAQRRDGTTFPLELAISAIRIGGTQHLIGILRDVTARREAERVLNATRASLMESEKMAALGNLVAGVAHEINTPVGIGVTAVSHWQEQLTQFSRQYAEGAMKRSDLERLLETGQRSARILEENLRRASQLIRSFKDIAVDQSGEESREIVLRDYIQQVITSLSPRLKHRPIGIGIEVDPLLRIVTHPGSISQILGNLVLNSLIHGFGPEESGQIHVGASLVDGTLQLDYRDDGRGMDDTTLRRIFEPFYTTRRGQGGSGLGMNIVYNLVTQKHGGTIRCDSRLGGGVHFTMTLPDARAVATTDTLP
jgi:PAS domain S-box-containing protein